MKPLNDSVKFFTFPSNIYAMDTFNFHDIRFQQLSYSIKIVPGDFTVALVTRQQTFSINRN